MIKHIVFAYDEFCPLGGAKDIIYLGEHLSECKEFVDDYLKIKDTDDYDIYQIINIQSLKVYILNYKNGGKWESSNEDTEELKERVGLIC